MWRMMLNHVFQLFEFDLKRRDHAHRVERAIKHTTVGLEVVVGERKVSCV